MSALGTYVAATLAGHRSRYGASAVIWRNTPSADGQGGETASWASSSTVTVTYGPIGASAQEREIAGRLAGARLFTAGFPITADVLEKDRVVIGSRTFEVAGVVSSSLAATKQVVLAELL